MVALSGCLSSAGAERDARVDRASATGDALDKLLWVDCHAAILPARCTSDAECDDHERERYLALRTDRIEWLAARGCRRETIDARLASSAAWIETPAKPVSCRTNALAHDGSLGSSIASMLLLPVLWVVPWLCPGP